MQYMFCIFVVVIRIVYLENRDQNEINEKIMSLKKSKAPDFIPPLLCYGLPSMPSLDSAFLLRPNLPYTQPALAS